MTGLFQYDQSVGYNLCLTNVQRLPNEFWVNSKVSYSYLFISISCISDEKSSKTDCDLGFSLQDLLDQESVQSDFPQNVDSYVTFPKHKGTFRNDSAQESQRSMSHPNFLSFFMTFWRLFCSKMYLWAFFRCKY